MTRKLSTITDAQFAALEQALRDVRSARANLQRAGAHKAAASAGRAVKSVEGALRHAYRRRYATMQRMVQTCGRANKREEM